MIWDAKGRVSGVQAAAASLHIHLLESLWPLITGCMEWPVGVYWGGGCPRGYLGLLHGLQCKEHHPGLNRVAIALTTRLLKTELWWSSNDAPSQQEVATQSALERGARVAVFVRFYSDCVCMRSVFSHKFVFCMDNFVIVFINMDPKNKQTKQITIEIIQFFPLQYSSAQTLPQGFAVVQYQQLNTPWQLCSGFNLYRTMPMDFYSFTMNLSWSNATCCIMHFNHRFVVASIHISAVLTVISLSVCVFL